MGEMESDMELDGVEDWENWEKLERSRRLGWNRAQKKVVGRTDYPFVHRLFLFACH